MSSRIDKRHQTYNALYKSDIFNSNLITSEPQSQKPKKKMVEQSISPSTQIKLFGSNNSDTNMYGNHPIPHKESRPIQIGKPISNIQTKEHISPQNILKPKTAYDRFLREFHNAEIDLTKISNTKGYLISELKKAQPPKEIISSVSNRIDSLKSNIFNDNQKESDNRSGSMNNINNKIQRNNWNTNLDWKNSQSELILQKHIANNNSVSHCQTLNDYYDSKQSSNIIRHRFMVFPANNIDCVELEKEFKDQGVHIYDVEKHSDWLTGHGNHLMYFYVRENDRKAFQLNFDKVKEKIEKEKGIQINFSSCDKVGIDADIHLNNRNANANANGNCNVRHSKQITQSNKQYLAMTSYNRPLIKN